MESITVPVIDFDDTSFEEAIDFLRVRVAETDPPIDPALFGSVRIAASPNADGSSGTHISSFSARNISAWKALKRIASDCHMKISSTDQGIELVPIDSEPVEAK